ncbi:MAG: putative nicotinate-nucleotide pyrophosphorylase [carboxylating] [Verrucomicrobia subdivision 3 bacterium]|nr:putative nicotinate-nucleotide pyrophosphorylase [carboxylating] [Limisphaerales bacterium]MCS1416544.1 putative nicotinate-nucleotide pyrophosphorylase [carboxylating] [Limisphaerales bacterium]
MTGLNADAYTHLIELALSEDIGSGDVTSLSVVPCDTLWSARVVCRQSVVVAGLKVATEVFRRVDARLEVVSDARDGDSAQRGDTLLRVTGKARSILSGERVALNFVQRLCGIATLTRAFVDELKGLSCKILDTRKTTPGWRLLEKHAVVCGGATNHRVGLFDMAMIKDNHLAVLTGGMKDRVKTAVSRVREQYPDLRVEVEADTVEQVADAVDAGADVVLLDNMSVEMLRQSVAIVGGRALTEASGGITLGTLRLIAETGVDYVSVGALTHSAPAADIALDIDGLMGDE